MASLFKRGDWYYLAFFDKSKRPQRKQIPLKTKSKRTAEKIQYRLEEAYALGEFLPWQQSCEDNRIEIRTIAEAIDAFMESRCNLRPATNKKYKEVLTLFQAYLSKDFPANSVTTHHVEQFLNAGKRKAITKKTYSTTLSPLFNWLIEIKVIPANPVKGIRLERIPNKFPKYLTRSDVDNLCTVINNSYKVQTATRSQWLVNVIQANVYLGLRISELINLKWHQVDLEKRQLVIANSNDFSTKSGKERTIPICDSVMQILSSITTDNAYVFRSAKNVKLSKQYVSRCFRKYARLAGLENVNFHSTRHTAASWLAQTGCGVEAIRRYMGHSSITVTQKYMHLSPDIFARQIEQAFAKV